VCDFLGTDAQSWRSVDIVYRFYQSACFLKWNMPVGPVVCVSSLRVDLNVMLMKSSPSRLLLERSTVCFTSTFPSWKALHTNKSDLFKLSSPKPRIVHYDARNIGLLIVHFL